MRSHTIVCRNCGNEIEFTDLEQGVISLTTEILASKGLEFNRLLFADKRATCCKIPDYVSKNRMKEADKL